jgi:hypothetical protein
MGSRLRKLPKLSERPPVNISADMLWKAEGFVASGEKDGSVYTGDSGCTGALCAHQSLKVSVST